MKTIAKLICVIMLNIHYTLYKLSFDLVSNIEVKFLFLYGGNFVFVAYLKPIAEFGLCYCIEYALYSL